MKNVSTYELRSNLSELLREVESTEVSIGVSRFGKPIVTIIPYSGRDNAGYSKYFGFLDKDETGDVFVNRVRRSSKEKQRTKSLRLNEKNFS